MSSHADTIRRRAALFSGRAEEQQLVNPDELWKLLGEHNALQAENQQLREALNAAKALSDFLENEKETTAPPDELLSESCVACESAADYDKEDRLSEALAKALAAVGEGMNSHAANRSGGLRPDDGASLRGARPARPRTLARVSCRYCGRRVRPCNLDRHIASCPRVGLGRAAVGEE